jgi:hypothetical protein
MYAADAERRPDQKRPWKNTRETRTSHRGAKAYAAAKPALAMLETRSIRRRPIRSASAPVSGADSAEAYVRRPRKRPAAVVDPPSSRIRKGAVGRSWKKERKTVNVNPHITKNRRVKRGSFVVTP